MSTVKIWEEQIVIPTYEIGDPDKNPMFLEKRVYQGSSGKVYPYPTIETISHEKTDKTYNAVYLENEYLKVMILPELGGRIQRAYDKTNDYDFVYYNQVIKPALVGLVGPWISGGIEFNWPQHHRPTTYMPVDFMLQENANGSKTLVINDVDQMYGTKGVTKFTLHPDKAYIEIKGQLYNRTSLPQTFLWWANPAVAVNDYTQSIFPPDVHNVYDHGKRAVSRFPIATGEYYKHDYSEGVDISRYKNVPVPTSYMAEKSDYDFVGGYDYQKEAGILHVADHHISPGKKQWTWGHGEFGQAWDRILTDEDGPYIELMTGVYTDNQPDFTWLKPFEEKTFTQYFMPYKKVGQVKNATINAILGVEVEDKKAKVIAYGTGTYETAKIVAEYDGTVMFEEESKISPVDIYSKELPFEVADENLLKVSVLSGSKVLVAYQAKEQGIPELAEPAKAARLPEEIMTNEELYLTAQHIEQYRHATYLPDPYYLEGLKRDAGDSRINTAYGMLLFRRGEFVEAEGYFRKAIERLTNLNPNPYNSEAYYCLGLTLFYQEKYDDAFDAFFKATWTNEQQEMSFYYLAAIQCIKKDYEFALELIEKGLVKNAHNIKARGLKVAILRNLGRTEEALATCEENFVVDPFDYLSRFEVSLLDPAHKDEAIATMNGLMRDFHENYVQIAKDYADGGFYAEAVAVLRCCTKAQPMVQYYIGYYSYKAGNEAEGLAAYQAADSCSPYCCFPNKLEDIVVLEDAMKQYAEGSKASYYLGNLYYDKLQFAKAIALWEDSEAKNSEFPTVLRNLAIAYYNKCNDSAKAKEKLERAFALDTTDARVFLELDQLYKKLQMSFVDRLANYDKYSSLISMRDDLYIEYVTLLNLAGRHQESYDAIMRYSFRPWEGAEGKITTQYKACLLELAKDALARGAFEDTKALIEKALIYPENLGEGRLEGTKDNHLYFTLGLALEGLGDAEGAMKCFELSCLGAEEPAGMMYYYDQPADMILYQGWAHERVGKSLEGKARFNKLIDYGEKHLRDDVKFDYFAVSLPDFLIFEEDMNIKNQIHCYYLMGLGNLGLGRKEEAKHFFEKALSMDINHQNCAIYKKMSE